MRTRIPNEKIRSILWAIAYIRDQLPYKPYLDNLVAFETYMTYMNDMRLNYAFQYLQEVQSISS